MSHAATRASADRLLALPMGVLTAVLFAACSNPPPAANAGAPPAAQSGAAPTATAPAARPASFTGTVVETMKIGGYTYLHLKDDQKDIWAAADEMPVKPGERLTVPLEMPMEHFHSNTLNRDFPLVYFVSQVAREGQALAPATGADAGAGAQMPMSSHGATTPAAPQAGGPVTVTPNAPPEGGLSIADVWVKRASLSGTPVTVRGTVVKVNNGILDRNWFHLQDGSGRAADGTHDLTVTSNAVVKVGDVVTVTGTLGIDKDFGAGYAYGAILEQAVVK